MHRVVAFLLVICWYAPQATAFQSPTGATGSKAAIRACSLLTKDLVTKFTPYEKEAFALVMTVPPQEDSVGSSGSACTYGGITMQVDPFPPATLEKQRQKTWAPVPDVGDTAYFRDNGGRWAELYVRAGARVLTLQMGVPTGSTAESIKSNVIGLAKALLPGLK